MSSSLRFLGVLGEVGTLMSPMLGDLATGAGLGGTTFQTKDAAETPQNRPVFSAGGEAPWWGVLSQVNVMRRWQGFPR